METHTRKHTIQIETAIVRISGRS